MQKAKFWIPFARHFLATGRISRLQYFVFSLIYTAIYFGLLVGAGMVLQITGKIPLQSVAIAIALTLTSWFYFCLDAKRLHDLNWPAVVAVLLLSEPLASTYITAAQGIVHFPDAAPVLHILDLVWRFGGGIIGLIMLFAPGNKGQNKYGPDPLRPPAPPIEVF